MNIRRQTDTMRNSSHRLFTATILLCMMAAHCYAQVKMTKEQSGTVDNRQAYGLENGGGEYGDDTEERSSKSKGTTWGRDSTKHKKEKPIPIGQFQWTLEPRLGTVMDAINNDTTVHNFQNWNNTDGYTGEYSYLGNIGSPRLNRIFMNRKEKTEFLLMRPFSYFLQGLDEFRFTNTKSPITNLAYHSCGNNQNGEDRIRAYFATNINKVSGVGLKADYLYGRGYYANSANSMFGVTGYGYYRGDKYNIHACIGVDKGKMYENGGIENDDYIENPQSFPQSYSSTEIPVMLSDTWNRNHIQKAYLTHKYNIGYDKEIVLPDSLKPVPPTQNQLLDELPDSVRTLLAGDSIAKKNVTDSLMRMWQAKQVTPTEFIPVASVIHTLEINNLNHAYITKSDPDTYYTNLFFGDKSNSYDKTHALSIRNTAGLAMREGFNKWAQMGITLFATHKLRSYTLLEDNQELEKKYNENDVSVGGELARTQGRMFHFNVNGEVWLIGPRISDFDVRGKTSFNLKMGRRDSLTIDVDANIRKEKPDFLFRHYHSQFTWWDNNDLSSEYHSEVSGMLRLGKMGTKLKVGFENIGNYTYFSSQRTRLEDAAAGSSLPTDFSYAVAVAQASKNIQVFGVCLAQDLKFGPFHWDTELTYQKSSSNKVLPLPQFNAYTNLYLLFRIAKVLRVQIGGDMRYFTSYYAPDWSPTIQQFAVQDDSHEMEKIGNYPIINAYANLHIKHCRLYVKVNHVNAGTGRYYLAPHYALNPLTIHFGISWNFFN